ncbi:MAG: hypothetical protein MSA15_11670 [Clostridium sp.]|nr:hypothetical protein [Clostridium sp.]
MVQRINLRDDIRPYHLTISKNDTIIIEIDQDRFDIAEAQQIIEMWKREYPKNKIMLTFKGIEVKGVINEN